MKTVMRLLLPYNDRGLMEFLPITKDGLKVYAGFWKRFGASLVDGFVLFLVLFPVQLILLVSTPLSTALVGAIILSIFFPVYAIFFHYRYGATIGKMITNIKVTLPNGSPIGIKEAFLRSSVELGLSIVGMFVELSEISTGDAEQYLSSVWHEAVEIIGWLWFWSEVVVLLFNERRRAIHDFIAGTVVVHKSFAK